MSKNYKLQNILFCDNDRLEAYWEMFFKKATVRYTTERIRRLFWEQVR